MVEGPFQYVMRVLFVSKYILILCSSFQTGIIPQLFLRYILLPMFVILQESKRRQVALEVLNKWTSADNKVLHFDKFCEFNIKSFFGIIP